MKPLAQPLDAEHVVIDYLNAALASRGQDVTVGANVPQTWTTATKAHVLVGHDGTPEVHYPIYDSASVRITCWSSSTTVAKDLARLCNALLLSHPGGPGVASIKSLTGVLPTKDPDTGAQLATIGVEVRLTYTVLA